MTSTDPPIELRRPERIGPIEIRRGLPRVAGADVYAGEDGQGVRALVLHWPQGRLPGVAVPALAGLIESLQLEEACPGLANVVHGSVSADQASVAFALAQGETLPKRLERGAASPVEALTGALSVVEGLRAARERGVPVGRWDPCRIMSLEDGPAWELAAPGVHAIAHVAGRATSSTLGEAALCAPEVATGAVQIRGASDVSVSAAEAWALGGTLFYALTGEYPTMTTDADEVLQDQLAGRVRDLMEVAPHLDRYRKMVALVRDCLQRAPAERPTSLDELEARLAEALREAERLDSDVAFLPARVSDTMEIRRARLREGTGEHVIAAPSRVVQFAALITLVAILLFLLIRQTSGTQRTDAPPVDPTGMVEPGGPPALPEIAGAGG